VIAADLTGIPLKGSPWIPEGKIFVMQDLFGQHGIYFHQRTSCKQKWRRPHGRRAVRKRMKETRSLYRPDYDKMLSRGS
jgi:hypothetical protein